MENIIEFNGFIKQLQSVDRNLLVPDIIKSPYIWLSSNLSNKGALVDNYVNSPLDHQYHAPWYILSSSIFYLITNNEKYKLNSKISLKYLLNLGYEVNKIGSSFIGFPLILASLFMSDAKSKAYVNNYITGIQEFNPSFDAKRANNIHCSKMIVLLLKQKVLEISLNSNELKFIDNIAYKKLSEWQYDDGFFFDIPYNKSDFRGVPHLTYHATLTMFTILASVLLEDSNIFKIGEKGLNALENLVSPTGEAGSYGRSNNAIFGYSSTIFAISIYHFISKSKKYDSLRNTLIKHLDNSICEDGHISIVPNNLENNRVGFDKYMFVTVYESWTLGLLLLSHILQPIGDYE
jgi:hypothetical protein